MATPFQYIPSATPPQSASQNTGATPFNYVPGAGATPEQPPQLGTLPKPQMPILTNEQGGFGTALKDVAVGAGKDLMGTARDTAMGLQGAGQMALGALTGTKPQGLKSLDNNTPEGAQINEQLKAKSRGEQVGKVLSGATQLVAPFAGGNAEKLIAKGKSVYEGMQASKETKAIEKVTEMISPKATVKQAKIAQTEGRLLEGKKPTLLRAGTEDKILPSKKTLSDSETIIKNIPGASKMSEGELYSAVDKNINDTATKLRPQMEQTPIKPETIQKINDDWSALKKSQMADAPATEETNVAKRQVKFESLLQKSGNQNHAELWDTAINYDKSIPDGVKKATSMSPESIQLQKQEWLDNRQILSDAIEKSSKPEFKQMSSMYNAKEGILSKTKVDKAQLSKVNQFLKDNPKVSAALGGATMYEVAKHLGIPLP